MGVNIIEYNADLIDEGSDSAALKTGHQAILVDVLEGFFDGGPDLTSFHSDVPEFLVCPDGELERIREDLQNTVR